MLTRDGERVIEVMLIAAVVAGVIAFRTYLPDGENSLASQQRELAAVSWSDSDSARDEVGSGARSRGTIGLSAALISAQFPDLGQQFDRVLPTQIRLYHADTCAG